MKLEELLEKYNKTIDDIKDIYHGKNNWCRCGCGGNYFSHGDKGFTRAINRLKDNDYCKVESTEYDNNWINIVDEARDNMAYTIYWKKEN